MAKEVSAGDNVEIIKRVVNRVAFYADAGTPGTTTITLEAGSVLPAAADEIGGNVTVLTNAGGKRLLVPLAEGEFRPAPQA